MCGIVGIWNLNSQPVEERILTEMRDVMTHRGPDGAGSYIAGPIGLGHRRLSIIDVEGGVQPMSNEDRTVWISFNGEIYNFRELACQLKTHGHIFRTRSDTEVIVHGYEEWGDDVVSHLNGIFAFALWDAVKRRVILARDHFGVKPIYYYADTKRLIFASELKALFLHPAVDCDADVEGIEQTLSYGFVPSPYTLFKGVRKLGPGHRLRADENGTSVERYWHPVPVQQTGRAEAHLIVDLRERLEAAVERQMVSDVPIGALLSGGIDSTAVVSMMRRIHQRVRTFSIGVRGEPEINELAAARATAERLGTEHEEIEIGAQDYMDFLEESHWYLEEPCTPSALLTYFVCKQAGRSVKVVLTGQGADELFGGYERYRGEGYSQLYQQLPRVFTQKLVPACLGILPGKLRWKRGAYALAESDPLRRFNRIYEVFSFQERRCLFHPEIATRLPDEERVFNPIRTWSQGLENLGSLDQLLYIDLRCNLADNLLLFGDKMSMAASVEARVPLLDLDLAAFAESIPACERMKGNKSKYLFKQALKGLLPREVLNRRKLGFQVPEAKWFQGQMFSYTNEMLLGADGRLSAFLDREVIRQMLHVHQSGRQNLWRQIFSLLSMEILFRSFSNSRVKNR